MNQEPRYEILVVDDESAIADLLVRTARLLFPEATFIHTSSAEQTLAYLDKDASRFPHLVLLDLDLKGCIDGLALLPQLYHRFKGQVPVVMLTGTSDQRLVYQAHDKGAIAYTEKPGDLQGWKDYVEALRVFLVTMSHERLLNLRPKKQTAVSKPQPYKTFRS